MAQATMTRPVPMEPSRTDAIPERGFRGDVEGLRAVAVGLVLLYHAGLAFVPGGFVGVDVFFVISGFLITGLLVKELRRTGRISLVGFYARRAKRLLPATAAVLIATAALVITFVPRLYWSQLGEDIVASALYAVNWQLAERSVDYLAEDSGASPVQHFWSLAVEEQYYLVWPVLLLLVTWWARSRGRSITGSLWVGLAVVGIPSLLWSIYLTSYEPARAFFVTTTRMWELAIGAAVAITASQLARIPQVVAIVLGWAGLLAIALSGLVYTVGTPWPGYAAALPTLGAAAVIATGVAAGRHGPVKLLGTSPFLWVGALSYSLYLWHWPLIVIATHHWGELSVERGLLVAAISVIPAWLTYRLIENPFRYSPAISRSPRLALSLGANATLIGVLAGILVVVAVPAASSPAANSPGAAVLSDDPRDDPAGLALNRVESITPDPLFAREDVPSIHRDNCQQNEAASEALVCIRGAEQGATTVAVVGDSKVVQWLPALEELAGRNDWKLVIYAKSGCAFADAITTAPSRAEPYHSCVSWNQNVLSALFADKPDYLITSQGKAQALVNGEPAGPTAARKALADGLRARWMQLVDAGIGVVVIRDTPWPRMQVDLCVSEHLDNLTACTYEREKGMTGGGGPTQLAALEGSRGVNFIDLNDAICPAERCPPVIGNVLVYRQGSHITATFARSLAPRLEAALATAGLATKDG
ncbi:MAG: acyltransferase [Sporichthyaceae bacterium]|nr:acyltransferase [Sporichthyaceae bacterium]